LAYYPIGFTTKSCGMHPANLAEIIESNDRLKLYGIPV